MSNLLWIVLLAAATLSCTGDERPPPSSPRDPRNPRAPETRFDPGADPFAAASTSTASAPPPDPHAAHQHGAMDGGAH